MASWRTADSEQLKAGAVSWLELGVLAGDGKVEEQGEGNSGQVGDQEPCRSGRQWPE